MSDMRYKALVGQPFEATPQEDGSIKIAGYASVFHNVDGDGEIMQPSAFDSYLDSYLANPVLMMEHGQDSDYQRKPAGKVTAARVDSRGLYIEATVFPSPLPAMQAAFEAVKNGLYRAFSVGGYLASVGKYINKFDLREISLVALPSNQAALRTRSLQNEGGDALADDGQPAAKRGAVLNGNNVKDTQAIRDLADGMLARHSKGKENSAMDEEVKGEQIVEAAKAAPTTQEDVIQEARKRLEVEASDKAAKEAAILAAMESIRGEQREASKAASLGYGAVGNGQPGAPAINYNRPRDRFHFGKALMAMVDGDDYKFNGQSLRLANKAMTQGTAGAVGFFVPEDWMSEIIPMLRFNSILPQLGVTSVPWADGYDTIHWPKLLGATTAYMVGEGSTITASDLSAGEVVFTEHFVAGASIASRQLLRNASGLDALIKSDLMRSAMLKFDQQVLEGDGTGANILGASATSGIGSIGAGAGAVNGSIPTFDDVLDLLFLVEQYGAQVDALVMHPRTLNRLRKLKDTTGNYFQNMNQGYNQPNPAAVAQDLDQYQIGAPVAVICGKPVFTTDQVSTTLTVGASSATSNVYAFDKESMAYSLKGGLIVEMSTEAGANTFLNHQAIIKVMMTGDAKVLRTQGVAKLTGCL